MQPTLRRFKSCQLFHIAPIVYQPIHLFCNQESRERHLVGAFYSLKRTFLFLNTTGKREKLNWEWTPVRRLGNLIRNILLENKNSRRRGCETEKGELISLQNSESTKIKFKNSGIRDKKIKCGYSLIGKISVFQTEVLGS